MPARFACFPRLMPLLLLTLFALFLVSTAPAMPRTPGAGGGSITGLFNTGLDAGGNPLADGGTDAHYALVSTPGGAGGTSYVTLQKFPIANGVWMADTSASKWISPYADESLYLDPPGNYTYQTTFTVSGDAATVQINGNAAADNLVTAIILNGQTVATNVSGGFQAFSSFTISTGFVSGTNTLQFIVNNQSTDNNPTGFRCEMTAGTVTPPVMGITGLFNTGLDASGNPGTGGNADPHYALVSTPGGGGGTAYVTLQQFPVGGGAWMDNTSTSKWISPTADESQQPDPPGDYIYQTTFTVTGAPATATIAGQVAADNSVTAIMLNGQTVATNVGSTFTSFTAFTIRSGFVAGVNTLRFVVHNLPYDNPNGTQNNPSGFRCEMTGSADPVSTPTSLTVYRLDNANTLDHICTTSATERDRLVAQGYTSKGVLGKTPPDSMGAAPVYRLVSSTTGRHLFTNSQTERSSLLANGWNDEGTAFTVYTASAPRRKPLFRLYRNIPPGETLYTNSQNEHDTLIAGNQWADQGIVGYLATPQTPHPDHPLPAWAEGSLASDGAGVTGSGPSSADQVNLASGVYENQPDADIGGLNTVGPSPVFARMYRTANALNGYASPGLPVGWTHNYDVQAQSDPNNGGLTQLAYPNGAKELWTPPAIDGTNGNAPVRLTPPQGAPYTVSGLPVPNTQNGVYWQWLSIMFKDRSRWIFTPLAGQPSRYRLTSIVNTVGRAITLQYDAAGRITSIVNDAAPQPATLLAFAYDSGLLSRVTEYADPLSPRYINYTTGASGADAGNAPVLLNVSQIGTVRDPHPARWTYDYQGYGGSPFLSMVSTPSLTGAGSAAHAITYDENGCVSRLTDADRNTRDYSYEAAGTGVQVQGMTGQGETWTQATNDANLDTGGTDALNKYDSVAYGDMANPYSPTSAINKNGQSAQMEYDGMGNALSATASVNGNPLTTSYTYDYNSAAVGALGQLTSVQTGAKQPTTIDYYANTGLVAALHTPAPGPNGGIVDTTYTYTALGNVATVQMPAPNDNGNPVQYTYNYTSDALDGTNQAEALGRPLTITDPMGHVTHLRYDARGNLIATITLAGGVYRRTDIQYNVADQPIQVMYPPTGQTGAGQSYTVTTYQYPGGPATMTALYDESGNIARQTGVGRGGEGQVKQQTGAAEHTTQAFDGLSRLSSLKDGNGNAFQHVYDTVGNLKQMIAPGGITQTANYDADGNVTRDTDGRQITANYALAGDDSRLKDTTYSDGTPAAHYEYDIYGHVTLVSDSTVTLTYAYDDLDNIIQATTTYADLLISGNNAPPYTFALDYDYYPDGRRKSLSSPTLGIYNYTYDNDGKLTSVSFPWGDTAAYQYDEGDRIITQNVSYPGVELSVTRYAYNSLDQLIKQESRDGTAQNSDLYTGYYNLMRDAVGNLTYMEDKYPLGSHLDGIRRYSYDSQDRLIGESASRPGAPGVSYANYTNYNYTHSYDDADNILTLRSHSTGLNASAQQLTADGKGSAYGYDAEGNTAQVTRSGQSYSPTYDANNNLTGYQGFAPAVRYRPDGLRGSVLIGGNIPGRIYRVYDGTRLLFDYNYIPADRAVIITPQSEGGQSVWSRSLHYGQASMAARPYAGPTRRPLPRQSAQAGQIGAANASALYDVANVYGWGATGLIETYVKSEPAFAPYGSGSDRYTLNYLDRIAVAICDPLGNVAAYTTGGQGCDVNFYDAFGLLRGYYPDGGTSNLPLTMLFAGQQGAETFSTGTDPTPNPNYGNEYNPANDTAGQILMGYRLYNPTSARFYTRDPAGYGGGVNLYAYCRNNPVGHLDPMGLQNEGEPNELSDYQITHGTSAVTHPGQIRKLHNAIKAVNGVVRFIGDINPITPLAKASTHKDNEGRRLSVSEQHFQEAMAALQMLGPVTGALAEELTASIRAARGFRGPAAKIFDWAHIFENHASWGSGAKMLGSKKTVFRAETEEQIQAIVMSAWKTRKSLKTQYDPEGNVQVLYEGYDRASKHTVHFWYVRATKTVRSAYPIR